MLLQTFLILVGTGLFFGLIAAVSKDRIYLYPAAGMFLLASFLLFLSGSLMIQDGYVEEVSKNITADTNFTERGGGEFPDDKILVNSSMDEFVDRTPTYEDLNDTYDLGGRKLSNLIGLVLLAIALYSFLIAPGNIKMRSKLDPRKRT